MTKQNGSLPWPHILYLIKLSGLNNRLFSALLCLSFVSIKNNKNILDFTICIPTTINEYSIEIRIWIVNWIIASKREYRARVSRRAAPGIRREWHITVARAHGHLRPCPYKGWSAGTVRHTTFSQVTTINWVLPHELVTYLPTLSESFYKVFEQNLPEEKYYS